MTAKSHHVIGIAVALSFKNLKLLTFRLVSNHVLTSYRIAQDWTRIQADEPKYRLSFIVVPKKVVNLVFFRKIPIF